MERPVFRIGVNACAQRLYRSLGGDRMLPQRCRSLRNRRRILTDAERRVEIDDRRRAVEIPAIIHVREWIVEADGIGPKQRVVLTEIEIEATARGRKWIR